MPPIEDNKDPINNETDPKSTSNKDSDDNKAPIPEIKYITQEEFEKKTAALIDAITQRFVKSNTEDKKEDAKQDKEKIENYDF